MERTLEEEDVQIFSMNPLKENLFEKQRWESTTTIINKRTCSKEKNLPRVEEKKD